MTTGLPLRIKPTPKAARLTAAGQRAMLRAEARTLRALRAVVGQALQDFAFAVSAGDPAHARTRALSTLRGLADRVRVGLAATTLEGRLDARSVARARFDREVRVAYQILEVGAEPPAPLEPRTDDAVEDEHRSAAAAESYVAAWRAGITVAVTTWSTDPKGSLEAALRAASGAQDHRLQRVAATETAHAYGDEHDDAADDLATRAAQIAPFLIKVWDASLDRRVCRLCRDLDGRWALVGTAFRGDYLPGEVHPNCRCTSTLLAMNPAVLGADALWVGATIDA